MYLYNLSNSPVLISEGPPSIYLDYPCGQAASFLLLSLLAGLHANEGCPQVPGTWHSQGTASLPCHSLEHLCVGLGEKVSGSFAFQSTFAFKACYPTATLLPFDQNGDGGEDPTNTIQEGELHQFLPNSLSSFLLLKLKFDLSTQSFWNSV